MLLQQQADRPLGLRHTGRRQRGEEHRLFLHVMAAVRKVGKEVEQAVDVRRGRQSPIGHVRRVRVEDGQGLPDDVVLVLECGGRFHGLA